MLSIDFRNSLNLSPLVRERRTSHMDSTGYKGHKPKRRKKEILQEIEVSSDEELLNRFLAGDMKLLGAYLMGPCYASLCALSRKFYSLNLAPDEVVSIACKQVLSYNMSLLRSYDKDKFRARHKAGDSKENQQNEYLKSESSLKGYIVEMTRRALSSLVKEDSETVGCCGL